MSELPVASLKAARGRSLPTLFGASATAVLVDGPNPVFVLNRQRERVRSLVVTEEPAHRTARPRAPGIHVARRHRLAQVGAACSERNAQ